MGENTYSPFIWYKDLFSRSRIKKSYNSTTKDKQSNLKMSKRYEETFLQRRYTNGQQAFEKMLNIFSHSVQLLSRVRLFVTPWTTAHQDSLSITNSWSLPKLMSIESVMPSNRLISSSVIPFPSCPQSFPASRSFQMSQVFTSGGQTIGVSASTSVLPMSTQDWSPLEWTGWISLQSKGLSRVFSNTTVPKHQFFSAQLSL